MTEQNKTQWEERKETLKLAVPMVGTQLLWMSMPFIDNIMVGRLGSQELAALGVASTYQIFLIVSAIGILSAINPMVSQAFGARDYRKIAETVQQGIWVGIGLSAVMVFLISFASWFLNRIGQDPILVEMGQRYLMAFAWGTPAQVGFIVLRQYCDAIGFPKPVITMVFIATLLNLGLDYGLIYGNGPFPKLGMVGAGFATSTVNWLLFVGLFLFTCYHPRFKEFHTWKSWRFNRKLFNEIWILGLPLAGGIICEVGYFSGSTWLAGTLGSLPVAAHQVALNVASITFMIPLGLGFAVSVRVGHFVGAGRWDKAREAGLFGIQTSLVLGCLNALFLFLGRGWIAGIYTSDPTTQELVGKLLITAAIFQVFDGLQCLGVHVLRGFKDTRIPFVNSVISYWLVGVAVSLYFCFYRNLGVAGIWTGMIFSLALAASLHFFRFQRIASKSLALP